MRKNIIVILCCIALGSFSGTFFWYQIQKISIKKTISEYIDNGIEKEKLVLLKFTYADSETKLRWEHSKEFEYNNQMYDVVEIEYKNDSVYYLCWHDKEETAINNQIRKMAKFVLPNNIKDDHKDTKSQKNLGKNLYCNASVKDKILLSNTTINYLVYPFFYSSVCYTPLTPPPNKTA